MQYRRAVALATILTMPLFTFGHVTNAKNGGPDDDTIIANEKQVLEYIKKKDKAGFHSLVLQEGLLVGDHGVVPPNAINDILFDADYQLVNITVESPQVVMIDKDAAILTYKSTGTESYKGQTRTETSYATTVWVKRGGKWLALFHQESMVPASNSGEKTSD